ncbi:MAG: n-acetylglutamate synthase [Lonepinella koalarum]|nr:n-acetylglutamate synthase [Lonepinella koalarum]
MNLHHRTFISVNNSENGEVNSNTLFYYYQQDNIIWAEYVGGEIVKGFLIGKFIAKDKIEFTYQHLNQKLENRMGKCVSQIEVLSNGKLRLYESWKWFDGEQQIGTSIIEEIQ